jgi:hypothetical protein
MAGRAASLDAAIDAHCSAPQAAAAAAAPVNSGSCGDGAGGNAGAAVARVAMPKQGDEVELVCQSLAFGGKVLLSLHLHACPAYLHLRLSAYGHTLASSDQHGIWSMQGVCKLDGLTIFCSRALPGEVLRARITAVKKSHALVGAFCAVSSFHLALPVPTCR